jgi:hypothetical protein
MTTATQRKHRRDATPDANTNAKDSYQSPAHIPKSSVKKARRSVNNYSSGEESGDESSYSSIESHPESYAEVLSPNNSSQESHDSHKSLRSNRKETPSKKTTKYKHKIKQLMSSNQKYLHQLTELDKKLKQALSKAAKSERALQVLRSTHGKVRSKKAIVEDPRVRQMKSELRAFLKYELGRRVKFLPKGYKKWSEKSKSICQIVVNNIKWWPDCSIEEKMDMWQRVLAANLKPMMTEYKNKIHQPMRHAFNGQYFI